MSLLKFYLKGTFRKTRKLLGFKPVDPYMHYKEVEIFKELLVYLKPARCLEYGSGLSTQYFTSLLGEKSVWYSLENNSEWFKHVNSVITTNRVKVSLIEVEKNNELRLDEDIYANYVTELGGEFDLILVDGINRENCIDICYNYLSPKGILVVHDANRVQFHKHIKKYDRWKIIEDYRKTAGGFGFASKKLNLDEVIDWSKHRRLWKWDSKVANFFKLKFLRKGIPKAFRFSSSHD